MDLRLSVENEIEKRTVNHEPFTAFDITVAVRQSVGNKINVKHSDVNQIVKEHFSKGWMSGYVRTTINIDSQSYPYLYHDQFDDPSNYGQKTKKCTNSITSIDSDGDSDSYKPLSLDLDDDDDTANTVDTVDEVDESEGKKIKSTPSENRLNIPGDIIKPAGLSERTTALIEMKNNKLIISEYTLRPIPPNCLKVNVDGRLRITKRFLKQITNNLPNTFNVSLKSDKMRYVEVSC